MSSIPSDSLLQVETTCGSLLYELQIIWDEVGESETDKDKMLLELEQECLQVYRRKVDQANRCRAQLRQAIADSEAELAAICSAMGERPVHIRQTEQKAGSLKEELKIILPQLEEMQKRKSERKKQFSDILEQIQKVSGEIYGSTGYNSPEEVVDEADLSIRKLEELQRRLQTLQDEKSYRLKQVMQHLNNLNSLCSVLGLDFKQTVHEVHPNFVGSEETYCMNDETLQSLESAIKRLRELKVQRMQRLQDLATTLLELWNLMDTPVEEQQAFQNVTCHVAASEDELNEPNMLSSVFIKYVEAEVSRLEELKSSKMKELVLKKRLELEEICRKTHMVPETDGEMQYIEAIESGILDPASVLEQIELEIAKVKEEAFSRKEILDKVEKWLFACEEESWLEEYNMDENRYTAGKGAHLSLKRAEKARALVNKLPGMVEALTAKARAWENERGIEFMYDGVPLISMLEEYNLLRQEKEQEKKRQREQKKLQGQLIAEQEALFGSKPSPIKLLNGKKSSRTSTGGGNNRRLSIGGATHQTPRPDSLQSSKATPHSRVKKGDRNDYLNQHFDDDSVSFTNVRRGLDVANHPARAHSFNGREPESPMIRKPLSPISSTTSSRANTTNSFEDANIPHDHNSERILSKNHTSHKTITGSNQTTPLKAIPAADEENRTPKAIPIPSTPSTVSAPMQTAITPVLPPQAPNGDISREEISEEIEYSFEERRAGFVLPNTNVKRAIQV
ncbi:hypothetical protein Ancab_010199 [Ancistrocladus abbreviatus]